MNSFIPWVGGKSKLLWIINKMAPDHYSRFIDVFGGSGTVTMSRPIQQGCMEVYNDFNSNLTNLFCCVKNRPLALLAELGFLPLNTRDDFNVLYKFLSKGEITDDYLQEEMELTEILLKPPEAEAIRTLLLERAPRGDVRRAADFFKLVRYSFSGSSKSFGGKPCDIRRFFHLIWECSRRLANVIVENKDFEDVIRQYDRGDAWIYCDPPYFEAECYEVAFPKENHQRLHDTLLNCHVTDKKEVVGKYATADLAAGDYILSSKLSAVPAAENAYLYNLDGKKQAISVTIKSFATGLSGKLESGDIVTVIVADYQGKGETAIPPELQYVEVISVTASSGYDANTGEVVAEKELPSTVTLLVTTEQAKVLAELEQDSELHLALVYRGTPENAAKFIAAQDALIKELYAEPKPENGGETAEGTESKESEGAEPSAESEATE